MDAAALDSVGGWDQFKITPYDELKFLFKTFREAYLEGRSREAIPQLEHSRPLLEE
jgi:hypothetical protein